MPTWSDQAATPVEALASQNTLEPVPLLAVAAEHVSDLSATDTNITGRHIGVRTDMLAQLAHKCHAESTDLRIRLALGVKVGATLAASHHHYLLY